ncbi:hypothetical protein C7N43_02500 [Sphingobacteriales bacterium UPWRP_1]|nr:hypothetical protein B6N25_06000 [Sphingobacteriales bacterium TSM_CSS]PSJ78624.1 hypothetical protein C7N43_02500 [Sphingobacteriales bacterium UPWRP_1]
MNYLAHFYLDHTDPRPHFTAGAMLPDLGRSFGKGYRIQAIQLPPQTSTQPLLHEVNAGVARHHHADKFFHTSAFFRRHFELVKSNIYKANLQSIPKYTYFVAHVLLEMLIDRLLMKQHPQLCNHYYNALLQTNTAIIGNYMQLWGMQKKETRQFIGHFELFCTNKYLYHYQTNSGLLYGLERMYRRVMPGSFSENDKQQLEACIAVCEQAMEEDLHALFAPVGMFGKEDW